MKLRSLRDIGLIYFAVIAVALFCVRTASYVVTRQALEQEVDRRLALEVREITEAGRGDLASMAVAIGREQRDHESADLLFALIGPTGRQLAGTLTADSLPLGYADFDEDPVKAGSGHDRSLSTGLPGGARLVVASDNDVIDRFNALLLRVQVIGFAVAMLIVAIGIVGVIVEVRGRLRATQLTAAAIMDGDFKSRIPQGGGNNEFDRQVTTFNLMLDRIDELMTDVKHAAKDVAHELKSPLARLRTSIGMVERKAAGTNLASDMAELITETDQLMSLFGSLMRLWEIEGGHRRERFTEIDLRVLAQEAVESLMPIAEERGQNLTISASFPIPMQGEANLLRQLLVNLIENALRHAGPGAHVLVTTGLADYKARLIVEDDGPGIPPDQHALVVRRFGRLDTAADSPGQGIGLTLVDAITRLHRGELSLEDACPGLRVVIDLPIGR